MRALWLGMLCSSIGDCFREVSVLALVISLTGTGIEMAVILLLGVVPLLFVTPMAGLLIDRYDTRKLMIGADFTRALLTLGFLAIHTANRIWLVYTLTALISVISIFYSASRLLLVSSVISQDNLISANSLFTLTSGFCLACGSISAAYFLKINGRNISFLFDSLTFIVSGSLLLGIQDGQRVVLSSHCRKLSELVLNYWEDVKRGISYLKNNPRVHSLLLFNVTRFIGSGALYMLLGVFGAKVFQAGDSGISAFYASFGIGIFVGGIMAKKISERLINPNYFILIGLAVLVEGVFIMAFSHINILFLSLFILTIAYFSRAFFLTFYDALIMYLVDDHFRGRIFSVDKVFTYTTMSLAMMACSWSLSIVSPQQLAFITGGFLFLSGILWLIFVNKRGFSASLSPVIIGALEMRR